MKIKIMTIILEYDEKDVIDFDEEMKDLIYYLRDRKFKNVEIGPFISKAK